MFFEEKISQGKMDTIYKQSLYTETIKSDHRKKTNIIVSNYQTASVIENGDFCLFQTM